MRRLGRFIRERLDVIVALLICLAAAAGLSTAGTLWERAVTEQYHHWIAVAGRQAPKVAHDCGLDPAGLQILSVGNGVLRWRYVVGGRFRHYVVYDAPAGRRTCLAGT